MNDKLNELVKLCGINDIEFTIHKSDDNSVEFISEEKKFIVNFADGEDKEFEKLLDSKILELKETFK